MILLKFRQVTIELQKTFENISRKRCDKLLSIILK